MSSLTYHSDALAWAEAVGEDVDGHRRELIHGVVVVASPPSNRHQRIAHLLARDLDAFFPDDQWVLQNCGILLRADTLVGPDVLVVADPSETRPSMPGQVKVAVEILSVSSRAFDLTTKARLYGEHGVNLWIVDPVTQSVTTYDDGRAVRVFMGDEHVQDGTGISIEGAVSRYFA